MNIEKIANQVALRFTSTLDVPPEFQGNPKTHGIDTPRGGGFSIMQNLQKSLVKEEDKERDKGDKKRQQTEEKINASDKPRQARDWWKDVAGDAVYAMMRDEYIEAIGHLTNLSMSFKGDSDLTQMIRELRNIIRAQKKVDDRATELQEAIQTWESNQSRKAKESSMTERCGEDPTDAERAMTASVREAMYWCGPDRTYRMTKQEQANGISVCPKCKGQMNRENFTRSEKLLNCPNCGFKVPSGKVMTKKIEIEIEPDGEVEVEVTMANCRRS